MHSNDSNYESQESADKPEDNRTPHNRIADFDFIGDDGAVCDNPKTFLPKINAGSRDAPRISNAAWASLQKSNTPVRLFCFGGGPARIGRNADGSVCIQHLDEKKFRHELSRSAQWIKRRENGDSTIDLPAMPSRDIVQDMLAAPEIPLPQLLQIVHSPVFSQDGSLKTTPGYDADCKSYYAPAKGFRVPSVATNPNDSDIEWARRLICDDLLGDFPFVGDAEKAHAVALALQPFARNMIDGCTPLYVIEKPTPGTGATKLVESLTWMFLGSEIESTTEAKDDDEWRKRITSTLKSAPAYLFIDNLSQTLASAHLSSAITAKAWNDRMLGFSRDITVKPHCTWIATGNNPSYSDEMTRRIMRIRLDARIERPYLRPLESFKHKLPEWAKENRPRLVWAALTLIRAWVAAGKPNGNRSFGMFESWAEVMGGILDVAGVPGFLGNLDELYESSNSERAAWTAFIGLWWDGHQDKFVKNSQIYPLVVRHDVPLDLGNGSDQSRKVKLGDLVTLHRDQVFTIEAGGQTLRLRLERSDKQTQRTYSYRLVRLGAHKVNAM